MTLDSVTESSLRTLPALMSWNKAVVQMRAHATTRNPTVCVDGAGLPGYSLHSCSLTCPIRADRGNLVGNASVVVDLITKSTGVSAGGAFAEASMVYVAMNNVNCCHAQQQVKCSGAPHTRGALGGQLYQCSTTSAAMHAAV